VSDSATPSGAALVEELLADLAAESDDLDQLVAGLDRGGWLRPTPASGWTIAAQIAHLAWTDDLALLAASRPDDFLAELNRLVATGATADLADRVARDQAGDGGQPLLHRWRYGRAQLDQALRQVPVGHALPWFGPPMSAASMATARLMETWAHGQDVADALGVHRAPTARLRHVARLATRTRDFAFALHAKPLPASAFRVELAAPDGAIWTFGPADADQRVTGPALDFCLLAVRRIHRADTALVATGTDADAWLDIVQAFAGPAGGSRSPRSRTDSPGGSTAQPGGGTAQRGSRDDPSAQP